MAMIETKCKYCQQLVEVTSISSRSAFVMHKDAPGSMYACPGSQMFLTEAASDPHGFPKLVAPERPLPPPSGFQPTALYVITTDNVKLDRSGTEVKDHIQERFEQFHKENPKIYDLLVKFAREAKNAGFRKFGMQAIVERVRWHVQVESKGEPFKINNDYGSRYARKIMAEHADLKDFFEIRILKAEKEDLQVEEEERSDNFWWHK